MRSILMLALLAFAWSGNAMLHCSAASEIGVVAAQGHQGEHGASGAEHHAHRHGAGGSDAHEDHAEDCRSAPGCAAPALIATQAQPSPAAPAAAGRPALDERYASLLPRTDSPPPRSVA